MLQRGRTRGSAESTKLFNTAVANEAELQRGRTRGSAERPANVVTAVEATVASTGPHSWECGERDFGVSRVVHAASLQRGRTRGSAESAETERTLTHGASASTGPHSWECGENDGPSRSHRAGKCFNGAALVGVRRACGLPKK